MKRNAVFVSIFLLVTAAAVQASSMVKYIDSDTFRKYLDEKKSVYMVDIQKKNDYLRHHFYGAVATNAYPVRSRQDKERLKIILPEIRTTKDPIVIIGPRGGNAAKRAFAFLQQQGVDTQRMTILKKGIRDRPDFAVLLNTYGQ